MYIFYRSRGGAYKCSWETQIDPGLDTTVIVYGGADHVIACMHRETDHLTLMS